LGRNKKKNVPFMPLPPLPVDSGKFSRPAIQLLKLLSNE
jgi:hypothetical protein